MVSRVLSYFVFIYGLFIVFFWFFIWVGVDGIFFVVCLVYDEVLIRKGFNVILICLGCKVDFVDIMVLWKFNDKEV